MRQSYPSDLTDAQWQVLEPLLPTHKFGRPRVVDIREVINAIVYVLCTGCGCYWALRTGGFADSSFFFRGGAFFSGRHSNPSSCRIRAMFFLAKVTMRVPGG